MPAWQVGTCTRYAFEVVTDLAGMLAGENNPGASKVARKVKSVDATPMFQNPGETTGGSFEQYGAEPGEKAVPVLVILENSSALDTTTDDVVQRARGVYACLSRHRGKVATGKSDGNFPLRSTCFPCPKKSYAGFQGRYISF